jgi:hypothetical protein
VGEVVDRMLGSAEHSLTLTLGFEYVHQLLTAEKIQSLPQRQIMPGSPPHTRRARTHAERSIEFSLRLASMQVRQRLSSEIDIPTLVNPTEKLQPPELSFDCCNRTQ